MVLPSPTFSRGNFKFFLFSGTLQIVPLVNHMHTILGKWVNGTRSDSYLKMIV
jgi:hypothetical protein